ncbi:LPS-assembly lipoprotein LptE [Lysobacter sp. cf310]|uniref:LPS-assembly lipoprotein LptE n=1 Tax=Lysobacter sp. cf310 TaxID=1761790 RepID=UPI0008E69F7C|nr:LPS assembly lipoprotein LptE [Lysobacter sp. cf310]SFK28792.1 LPS-assembly lipoprotein [Lysobacter sp. cf310]
MTRRPFIAAATAALVLALSACGFQLRSALTLPPDLGPVRVVSVDRYSPLAESLATALTRAGAVPATPETESAAVLDLLSERWGDTPVALDQLGRTQEYSLRYAVIFELRKADGTALVPRQTVELSRDYVSNPVNSLGTEGEREVLQREMRREMSASVLRRIDAVVKKVDGGAAAPSARRERPIATDAAQAAMEAAESVAPQAPAKTEPAPPKPR